LDSIDFDAGLAVYCACIGWCDVSLASRKAARAVLIGILAYIFALIYVPGIGLRIVDDNLRWVSLGLAAVLAFFAYRFQ
jgi:hypothetical protein